MPLTKRVRPAPQELLDYLRAENERDGFPQRPTAATVPAAFFSDVTDALSGLPGRIQAMFGDWIVGVFLVEHLGSTAYTETILDKEGQIVGGFLALDADN